MIKRILFLSWVFTIQAWNASDCKEEDHEQWFCDYVEKHNRQYRIKNVRTRKKTLMRKLSSENGVHFGHTSRSDRFPHELKRNSHLKSTRHLSVHREKDNKHVHLAAPRHLPSIDWRSVDGRTYVTSVKDQGDCGGCFSFASATVLEYWSKKKGYPKSLSSQNLMDCTSGRTRPDDACDGGLMEYVFEYAMKHPVPLEVEFPYEERADRCPKGKLWSHVKVGDYKVLMHSENRNAENELEWLLHAYGPVAVGIDSKNMDDYTSGIFKASMCSTDIDHAVTIVGYTKDAWIIKNSWGPLWGQDGYLYLERGKNACGVAEYIVYVTDAQPALERLDTYWYKLE